MNSYVSVSPAFGGKSWVSGTISAVIVNGPSLANPFESSVLVCIKILELFLIPPTLSLSCTELGFNRSFTTVDVESSVGSNKRSFRPVGFLKSSSGGPVVGVPETRVDFHWLVEWKTNPQIFAVFEHSYWYVIHKETVWKITRIVIL